jgi:ABC-2 type transport system ATP-binding protein
MSDMIAASHLRKAFGGTQAVDDVNLSIAPGEIYGLVGSDGAGKTTTIRLLVGALKPEAGEAAICGYNIQKQTEQARAQLGYLSQRFSLYEDLTVLENIRFFAELRGLRRDEWLPRCMEILEFVGLADFKDRRAGQLSGGMKQKLGLASALVTHPQVLLLDEPTTGVDPVTRQDFWQLIIRLVSPHPAPPQPSPSLSRSREMEGEGVPQGRVGMGEGGSVLLTTPYMDEASRCHRVGFMQAGRIIAEGSPSELRARLEDRIVEVRGSSLRALQAEAEKISGVEDVRAFGDKLHLRVAPGRAEPVISTLAKTFPASASSPVEARLIPPTLEDVFISLSEDRQP